MEKNHKAWHLGLGWPKQKDESWFGDFSNSNPGGKIPEELTEENEKLQMAWFGS